MTDHHHHIRTTPAYEETEGPALALIAVLAILLVAFLIWFFGFSGVVFDRGGGGTGTTIEQNVDQGDTGTGGGGNVPSPATS